MYISNWFVAESRRLSNTEISIVIHFTLSNMTFFVSSHPKGYCYNDQTIKTNCRSSRSKEDIFIRPDNTLQ